MLPAVILALDTGWTQVIIALVTLVGTVITALLSRSNYRSLKTPSGPPVGKQVEQANALSAVTLAHTSRLLEVSGASRPTPHEAINEAESEANGLLNGDDLPRGDTSPPPDAEPREGA